MRATPEQKIAGETKRFEAKGYSESEALERARLAILGPEAKAPPPPPKRDYRAAYESELKRTKAMERRIFLLVNELRVERACSRVLRRLLRGECDAEQDLIARD